MDSNSKHSPDINQASEVGMNKELRDTLQMRLCQHDKQKSLARYFKLNSVTTEKQIMVSQQERRQQLAAFILYLFSVIQVYIV